MATNINFIRIGPIFRFFILKSTYHCQNVSFNWLIKKYGPQSLK